MILKAEGILASYGRVKVLNDINMSVESGEIVCLVGANGAGKSTLLKVISGIVPAATGKFLFEGKDITNKRPDFIVKAGLSHVPEGRQIFADLTVRQNLLLGSYVHKLPKQEMIRLFDSVFELFPILKSRLTQKAGTMSGGEQQMLAIGRGLMSQPKLLLLDEPSLGLAPLMVETILRVIQNLRSTGISILLVEQNVNAALQISDRAYVMETGSIVAHGKARELMENDEIRKSYLGM
jgi:branched-chain amino acid transport system ATP-binding protein